MAHEYSNISSLLLSVKKVLTSLNQVLVAYSVIRALVLLISSGLRSNRQVGVLYIISGFFLMIVI